MFGGHDIGRLAGRLATASRSLAWGRLGWRELRRLNETGIVTGERTGDRAGGSLIARLEGANDRGRRLHYPVGRRDPPLSLAGRRQRSRTSAPATGRCDNCA